ncbi:hypothetical protein [Agriterribacter sp.]|uniref:hypothetical protein n=1 Tax=Agriterribacter sp. TaxID=2821509 RepID=UPI002C1A78D6|nr:hypothetical protein [Agriterribacter sp.]HRO45811.1 hypothetical protein [Agriterribacter sp.]HRQ16734.1 hypothetical protein [Agriterribacter sp.]
MKIVFRVIIFCVLISYSCTVQAQDTLPGFTVANRNGKVILSWVNDFPVIKQLSIQRSSDSLKGFKTILTLPDPSSVTNGFLDNNAPDTSSYYKLYILLDDGKYTFSKSQKPQKYLPAVAKKENMQTVREEERENTGNTIIHTKASGSNEADGNGAAAIEETSEKSYEVQSAAAASGKKRSDGLKAHTVNAVKPETFTPSGFVFTNADGDITIVLPPGKLSSFTIKFYEQNGNTLFQINTIKEHIFTVDKSNFLHAGWFGFELFEDGMLKEKNKVRVP